MNNCFVGNNSGFGNALVRVQGESIRPLQPFHHPKTLLPLPWEWRITRYGRWMVCYAMLLSAFPEREDLARQLAQPLADHLGGRLHQVLWEVTMEELTAWAKAQAGEIL